MSIVSRFIDIMKTNKADLSSAIPRAYNRYQIANHPAFFLVFPNGEKSHIRDIGFGGFSMDYKETIDIEKNKQYQVTLYALDKKCSFQVVPSWHTQKSIGLNIVHENMIGMTFLKPIIECFKLGYSLKEHKSSSTEKNFTKIFKVNNDTFIEFDANTLEGALKFPNRENKYNQINFTESGLECREIESQEKGQNEKTANNNNELETLRAGSYILTAFIASGKETNLQPWLVKIISHLQNQKK